jgi:hypothetical protein
MEYYHIFHITIWRQRKKCKTSCFRSSTSIPNRTAIIRTSTHAFVHSWTLPLFMKGAVQQNPSCGSTCQVTSHIKTWKFITVFIRARLHALFRARSFQSKPSNPDSQTIWHSKNIFNSIPPLNSQVRLKCTQILPSHHAFLMVHIYETCALISAPLIWSL